MPAINALLEYINQTQKIKLEHINEIKIYNINKFMALDIAAAMDTLGIKNADIFGVSQGGMIAQYLAIDRPDLVNKLVLAVTLS